MALPILPTSLSIPPITRPDRPRRNRRRAAARFNPRSPTRCRRSKAFSRTRRPAWTVSCRGEGEELHHVAIATQQAELSFQLFMQVRNKIVAAYQQVMQMQV